MEKLEQIRGVSIVRVACQFQPTGTLKWAPGSWRDRTRGGISLSGIGIHPGDNGYKMVDYGRLSAVLIEAVKQLKSENGMLRSRLDALELTAVEPKLLFLRKVQTGRNAVR